MNLNTDMSVETVLREREKARNPFRVGVIGAGATGRTIAMQLGTPVPGLRLAAIANRTPARGERALREAGITDWRRASSVSEAQSAIVSGHSVLTDDPSILTACDAIDIIVEVTGTIPQAAHVALDAFNHGKPVVLVNAELDSLLGPILKVKASEAGVVLTHTDGDEPGVALTLLRYLRSMGLRPVASGNIKGMVDYYRTPDSQRAFAEKYEQDVLKTTSFADATKLSMESTVQANATGFHVARRGMNGYACEHVRDLAHLLPADEMLNGGLVDYAVGAAPHTGAFVVVHETSQLKRAELARYKMGEGPFFVFYTPFHLPHIQVASTIGRALVHRDATVTPIDGPVCEVMAVAKRDLKAGERLDGIGGFCTYGLIENAVAARSAAALPIGLSEGCVLLRDVHKDTTLSFADVKEPARDALIERLWREQNARWPQVTDRSREETSNRPAGVTA